MWFCFAGSRWSESNKRMLLALFLSRPPRVAGETAICSAAVPFIFFFLSLGPDFLDNGSLPSLNGSPQNLHTLLGWCQGWSSTFDFFSPTPKKLSREKPQFSSTAINWKRITSKWLNIDKRISDVSSRINALQNSMKLEPSSQGVFLQPRENVGQPYKWCAKTCVLCRIAQNFLLIGP